MAVSIQKQNAAYEAGQTVSKRLSAYTTQNGQKEVVKLVREKVDAQTVKSFLQGFKNPKIVYTGGIVMKPLSESGFGKLMQHSLGRDKFFDQIMTEYGFEEKEQVARDVAGKLKDYLSSQGRTKEADEIQKILNNRKIYDEDIKDLDDITNRTIEYNY